MRVLVTGATGHIGNNLVRLLLQQGDEVRVLLYDKGFEEERLSIKGLQVERFAGDICKPDTLPPAFEGVDIVYHLAAAVSIDERDTPMLDKINVQGTRHVVNACVQAGVRRLVHFSSIHALAFDPKNERITESRKLAVGKKYLAYDDSKARGELEALKGLEQGLEVVILNPVGVTGPSDYEPSHMGLVVEKLATKRMLGLLSAGFYWVDVRDVVQATLAAATKGRSGERYILAGEYCTLRQVATWVEEVSGVKAPRITAPIWLARIGVPFSVAWARLTGGKMLFNHSSLQILVCHQDVSAQKARKELDFHPRPIEQSIKDSALWMHENRQIPLKKAKALTQGSSQNA